MALEVSDGSESALIFTQALGLLIALIDWWGVEQKLSSFNQNTQKIPKIHQTKPNQTKLY